MSRTMALSGRLTPARHSPDTPRRVLITLPAQISSARTPAVVSLLASLIRPSDTLLHDPHRGGDPTVLVRFAERYGLFIEEPGQHEVILDTLTLTDHSSSRLDTLPRGRHSHVIVDVSTWHPDTHCFSE